MPPPERLILPDMAAIEKKMSPLIIESAVCVVTVLLLPKIFSLFRRGTKS